MVESDAKGYVTAVFGDTRRLFNSESDYLLGKQVIELYPLLRDGEVGSAALSPSLKQPYEIPNNVFLLNDGSRIKVKSRISPRRDGGVISGHIILNWLTQDK